MTTLEQQLKAAKATTDKLLEEREGPKRAEIVRQQKLEKMLQSLLGNSELISYLGARQLMIPLVTDENKHDCVILGPGVIIINHFGDNVYSAYYHIKTINRDETAIVCNRSSWNFTRPGDPLKSEYPFVLSDLTAEGVEEIVTQFVDSHP